MKYVNEPQTDRELDPLRASVARGRPYGSESWQRRVAKELALQYTLRRRGPVPKAEPVRYQQTTGTYPIPFGTALA